MKKADFSHAKDHRLYFIGVKGVTDWQLHYINQTFFVQKYSMVFTLFTKSTTIFLMSSELHLQLLDTV